MKAVFYIYFLCVSFLPLEKLIAQNNNLHGLDISMRGYIFLTKDGLFFQPLAYMQKTDFLSSLNNSSFQIDESDMIIYSEAIKGVGTKLIVKKYSEEIIKKRNYSIVYDTINYFKCEIDIGMNFFDTNYVRIKDVGYGFFINDSLIYYGNLSIRNQLLRIIPDDVSVLKHFYNSYTKKKLGVPDWLKKLYSEKVLKHK